MNKDVIYNEDCLEGMRKLPDNCVDLVVTDPPYEIVAGGYGGTFGSDSRNYHSEIKTLSDGINNEVLDELVRVMKKINIYIWCNKNQLRQYIDYFDDRGCNLDLLTWHKTNPIPTCSNKYLSDTEYLLFFREDNTPIYGSYETKKKWYLTPVNKADKDRYNHPTIKPIEIIENLIINSSKKEDVILDCYMGSGTTAVACMNVQRHFIGYEIDKTYYDVAMRRIRDNKSIFR